MRGTSAVGRGAAMLAVVLAAVVVVVVVIAPGRETYRVDFLFQNAGQLVKGNLVQISGAAIGKIEEVTLTPDGQARVITAIDPEFGRLRQGTRALIRQSSLSGVANRYIDLQLGPATASEIADGGTITQADTTTAVDLDQLFNVFGPRERRSLQGVLKGFAQLYSGRERDANRGLAYLNPAIASTSRLTRELAHDEPGLRGFISETADLVSDINTRRDDLSSLIVNLDATTQAIGRRDTELQDGIRRLPDFMRRANTTFVNLRSTLDDLDPLVEESKPVARKLRPFLAELRPLASDARPTLRDLSRLLVAPGEDNDLVDATLGNIPVRNIAVGDQQANGKTRRGAFPESIDALKGATPELNYAKPYAVDLIGWFDDFSNSGYYDALGSVGRVPLNVNALALVNGVPVNPCSAGVPGGLPPFLPLLESLAAAGAPGFGSCEGIQEQIFNGNIQRNQNNRCPGSSERDQDGSNPYIPPLLRPDQPGGCDPTQVPQGK